MIWFKHDTNANRDAKLRKLRLKYGMAAYGLYWYLIEKIAEPVNDTNFTFTLEDDSELVAEDVGISQDLVEEMMTMMVKLKLFEEANGAISCMRLARTLTQAQTNSTKTRQLIANMRGKGATPTAKKVKPRFVKPTLAQVKAYIIDAKLNINADAFIDYYESKGWVVGSSPMKSWEATARNWHRRDNPTIVKEDYSDFV